jgi:hypothetical protein
MVSSPKPPNPMDQANAQNSQSMWSSMWNTVGQNANVNNPYGSTTSSISGYVPYTDPYTGKTTQIPQWTQNTTLSPAQQAIFDQENAGKLGFGKMANAQMGRVSEKLATPIDYSQFEKWRGYDKAPTLQTPDENYRRQIESNMAASFDRANAPVYAAEDAQLAARGMGGGSKMAYTTQQGRYDAADEAARQRYNQSGQEARAASEGFNKPTQQDWLNRNTIVDQGNAMRQGQIAEAQGERTNILNELMSMFGMGQATVPNAPAFQSGQVNPFDIAGAMDKNYQYNAQNAANKNAGIFGLLGNFGRMGMGMMG